MAALVYRTLEHSKDENGRLVILRRFYWKRRRIASVFTFERGEKYEDGQLKAHHVTLFGKAIELATFIFDRHENVYVDADDGTIYATLRDGVQTKLLAGGYITEVTQ